jgi:3-carboxy-cis,cis-muconate cycloisomerase
LPSELGLFDGLYRAGPVRREVEDQAWLAAMLEFEAALAATCEEEGLIPSEAAEAIARACRPEQFDLAALAAETARHATPVVGLVRALREAVGDPHADYVHHGATSQDVVDTAVMLISKRALEVMMGDVAACAFSASALARAHVETPMVARTLLQQALPVSFGLVAAGWAQAIGVAGSRLQRLAADELPVQMGGPVGSADPALAAGVAWRLGLKEPPLPWGTIRLPTAELAGALGALSGVVGKVARDVTLLSQPELGELREGGDGRGASSAMAHKRNPVASIAALSCTKRVPGLVATVMACMEQEGQRAAGAWQAEWGTLTELITLTGSAVHWASDLLGRLEVDPERMRENLRGLARSGVAEAEEPERHLGAAAALIDQTLGSAAPGHGRG